MNLRTIDSPLSCGDAILLTTIVLASFGHWIGAAFCIALYLLGRSQNPHPAQPAFAPEPAPTVDLAKEPTPPAP